MARGITVNRKREKEARSVDLISPHGTEVTVTPTRAKQLLERPPIPFANGVFRKYAEVGESNVVDMSVRSGATPPRKGSQENTPGGE
jgi:hypothetical protein